MSAETRGYFRLHRTVRHVIGSFRVAQTATGAISAQGIPVGLLPDRYEQESAAGPTQTAISIIGRIKQDPKTGNISPSELKRLEDAERKAAEAADYHLAQELQRVRAVLTPRQRVSAQDCATHDVAQQIDFFLRNGFCIIPDVVAGEQLSRLQAAWERAAAPERARWQAAKADVLRSGLQHPSLLPNGTYAYDSGRFYPESTFDIGNLLAKDDIFLEIIDHPKLVPLLSAVVGSGGITTEHYRADGSPYNGMMRVSGMGGRIVPSEGNHGHDGQCGYISWHRDKPPADGWPQPNYRMIKCFLNVYDVPENGGETAVVPGSFRLQSGPAQTLDGNFTSSTADRAAGGRPGQLSHHSMPNYVGFSIPAGWVGLFDSSSWHTSMPNTSTSDRCTCLFSYRSSECYSPQSRLPTWGGSRAGLSEDELRAAADRGALPVTRRRVLGLPDRLPWEEGTDETGTWVDGLGRIRPASEKGQGKHG